MSGSKRTPSGNYSQQWSSYNEAQTNEKRLFLILLRELCSCIEEPEQLRGRPRLQLRDMIFCTVFKIYSTFSSRRFATDVLDSQIKKVIDKAPHFNSLSKYLRTELLTDKLTKLIEISSLPLEAIETDFAVDATGLSTGCYKRWFDVREMQAHSRRMWIKVHLICGTTTNIVTSVITTPGEYSDNPQFGRLVEVTARNFKMAEISADKGYFGAENMRSGFMAGATTFIPFKSNNALDADYKSMLWKRMLYMYKFERSKFMAHYNKRNNVETTFSMIKAKFGRRLLSTSRQAQFNEALCKVLCHNLCVLIMSMYKLGIDPEFCSEILYNSKCEAAKPLGRSLSNEEYDKIKSRLNISKRKRGRKAINNQENQMLLFATKPAVSEPK